MVPPQPIKVFVFVALDLFELVGAKRPGHGDIIHNRREFYPMLFTLPLCARRRLLYMELLGALEVEIWLECVICRLQPAKQRFLALALADARCTHIHHTDLLSRAPVKKEGNLLFVRSELRWTEGNGDVCRLVRQQATLLGARAEMWRLLRLIHDRQLVAVVSDFDRELRVLVCRRICRDSALVCTTSSCLLTGSAHR